MQTIYNSLKCKSILQLFFLVSLLKFCWLYYNCSNVFICTCTYKRKDFGLFITCLESNYAMFYLFFYSVNIIVWRSSRSKYNAYFARFIYNIKWFITDILNITLVYNIEHVTTGIWPWSDWLWLDPCLW